MEYTE